MKIRLAVLLAGVFLFAAMSVWPDGIACTGSGEKPQNAVGPIETIDSHRPGFAPGDAGTMARTPFAQPWKGSFGTNCVSDFPQRAPMLGSEMFRTLQADTDADALGRGPFDLYGRTPSFIDIEMYRTMRHNDENAKGGSAPFSPVSAPEPGSLALSLFGLICIELLARRRGLPQEIQNTSASQPTAPPHL
jgi:hypothetical protein